MPVRIAALSIYLYVAPRQITSSQIPFPQGAPSVYEHIINA